MKNRLIIALILFASYCGAQQDIYKKVCELIKQTNPDLIIESKLLVINFDNSSGQINKEVYAELEKTASVYEFSKLKGGRKGVLCVSIVPNIQTEIALTKEGYKKTIKIKSSDLESVNSKELKNIAFNTDGEIVFKNISEKEIYNSVHNLITR